MFARVERFDIHRVRGRGVSPDVWFPQGASGVLPSEPGAAVKLPFLPFLGVSSLQSVQPHMQGCSGYIEDRGLGERV